ncbi:hypothetical protein HPP92_019006 [Vanilla planifolia]|uniref:Clp R domain-containing protein n=1 Tax=Vanilla planifolia TaxID=51239 RepID=A0A835UPX4_VANPL|nr:hypothetical protein HPP92_019006 [Vanilla planifolia]
MPTPVSNARQCLGDEAAAALEAAVSAARSRSHAQTTSLHVVFALLSSSPSSPSLLRDALSRVRTASSSPRLQLKAIEFCFGVSLDRLPSSSTSSSTPSSSDDPPVSNSLMAAIKRSQAIQRRHPDTFHLYQQQQSSADPSSAFSGVKVELQQLVLAILDDPIVSRVFSSSGFRSSDIKFAILRPPPAIFSFPNPTRCPPLFLSNFSDTEGLGFPLPVADVGNENCRRIVEVIIRKTGSHNPMLVGVGAAEAAGDFIQALERRKWEGMPQEIHGLRIASIERVLGDGNPDDIYEKLEKVGKESEDFRIALSIGDMQRLLEVSEEVIGRLVSEVTRVLELRPGKLWVLGWSATYETYLKFLSRYPLLEKDWALQLLPITSHRAGFGGLHPKPPSIMGSFVPFGGLFSPVEPMDNSGRPFKSMTRCLLCNEKYEQEVFSIQKGSSLSLESLHQLSMPSWLKKGDAVDMVEEDKDLLNARIVNLQKKWNKYCRDVHGRSEMLKTNNSQALLHFDSINCASSVEVCCKNTMNPYATQNQSIRKDECTIPVGATKTIPICTGIMSALASVPTNSNLISNLQDKLSDGKSLRSSGLESQQAAPLDLSSRAQHSTSPITSVPTDLVLGSVQEPFCLEAKPAFSVRVDQSQGSSESSTPIKISGSAQNVSEDHVSPHFVLSNTDSAAKSVDLYARFSSNVKSNPSAFSNEQWCWSTSNICQKFDSTNDKSLYMSLLGKVGRQEEALLAISEAIIHCKAQVISTMERALR